MTDPITCLSTECKKGGLAEEGTAIQCLGCGLMVFCGLSCAALKTHTSAACTASRVLLQRERVDAAVEFYASMRHRLRVEPMTVTPTAEVRKAVVHRFQRAFATHRVLLPGIPGAVACVRALSERDLKTRAAASDVMRTRFPEAWASVLQAFEYANQVAHETHEQSFVLALVQTRGGTTVVSASYWLTESVCTGTGEPNTRVPKEEMLAARDRLARTTVKVQPAVADDDVRVAAAVVDNYQAAERLIKDAAEAARDALMACEEDAAPQAV